MPSVCSCRVTARYSSTIPPSRSLRQLPRVPPNGQIANVGPVVGSGPSRVDIVDLTVGTTFLIGNRTTLATAFTVPLTSGYNRTFDWEAQVQLNFYFGGPR